MHIIYLKEIHAFIQQGCIKLIKSGKDISNVSKDLFQINSALLNFLFICESWKIQVWLFPQKNIVQLNCFQHW